MNKSEIVENIQVFGLIILSIGYPLSQIYAAYLGITEHLNLFWFIIALIIVVIFRFPYLFIVGAFFGAMDVWGWHWSISLLFVAPGLIVLIPAIGLDIINIVKEKFSDKVSIEPRLYRNGDLQVRLAFDNRKNAKDNNKRPNILNGNLIFTRTQKGDHRAYLNFNARWK